jgi:hypothetical protein
MRDMSKKDFDAACERRGFEPQPFLGYYKLPSGIHVSILNAKRNRRAQLAYLIMAESREQKDIAEAERLGMSIYAYKNQKGKAVAG